MCFSLYFKRCLCTLYIFFFFCYILCSAHITIIQHKISTRFRYISALHSVIIEKMKSFQEKNAEKRRETHLKWWNNACIRKSAITLASIERFFVSEYLYETQRKTEKAEKNGKPNEKNGLKWLNGSSSYLYIDANACVWMCIAIKNCTKCLEWLHTNEQNANMQPWNKTECEFNPLGFFERCFFFFSEFFRSLSLL